jgi:nucleoside-diphosphate-sugar epimerase
MEGERLNMLRQSNPRAPDPGAENTRLSLDAMTIAVTGANGFIGARVIELLATLDSPPKLRPLSRRHAKDQRHAVVDLADPNSVSKGLAGCDAVIHCAFDFLDMAANPRIAAILASECAAIGARLVHVSTAAVYEPFSDGELDESRQPGDGGSDYKHVKLAIEDNLLQLARERELDLVIIQPTVVYGPFGRAWTDSPIRELLTGTVVLPDEGRGLCNAVFVDDVCQAVISALTAPLASGERFLISGPAAVMWKDFYTAYQDILGVDAVRLQPAGDRLFADGPVQDQRCDVAVPSIDKAADRDGSATVSPALAPGKRLKNLVTKTIGSQAATRLNMWVSFLLSRVRGGTVHNPTGAKFAMFRARCNVRIDKARRLLAYEPRYDLEAGMRMTSPYIVDTYGRLARLKSKRKL